VTTDPPSKGSVVPGEGLDVKTVELLALSVFRTIFGHGVRVPLKVEGVMDMDLIVRDTNVILNLNQIQMHGPELSVWRLVFAYQGKPVVEYGRGIKNDMRIHIPQLCFLLLAIWRDKRKIVKAKAAADAAQRRAAVRISGVGPNRRQPYDGPD
jgi:hypothetical protein